MLAAKERQSKEAAEKARQPQSAIPGTLPAPQGSDPGEGQPQGLPPADFQALVGTMVTQALMYMGAFPDPETGRAVVSLEHARFHIDLLGVLDAKCKGNLTPEESGDLSQTLNELRHRFVEIVQAVAQMKKEGKLKPAGAGGTGGGGGMAMGGPLGAMG